MTGMIDKEILDKEKQQWEKFYNNYESIADNLLVTALAYYDKDRREEKFKSALEVLESLNEPINGQQLIESTKLELESKERISNEAKVAIRTINWVLENIEENDSEKCVDKES